MANPSKPEEPPDADQTMEQTNLGWESGSSMFRNALKGSEGQNSAKTFAGVEPKNSNVKKQKVSPEIDDPSSLSELVRAAVRDIAGEFAKTMMGKVAKKVKKMVETVKKVVDFFAPDAKENGGDTKEAKAKKEMEERTKREQIANANGKAQTKQYLKLIADQLKRFTDALAVLLNPASKREAGSRSGYVEEGRQAVDGLREFIQNISKNASPQLRQYLKQNNLDPEKTNGLVDWLDRLGAAMKTGDEKALQGFREEWKGIQKQLNRFLNTLLKAPEAEAIRKQQRTEQAAEGKTLQNTLQRRQTTLEAERNKFNSSVVENSRSPENVRKQNQPKRVLTNIQEEQKKLVKSNVHHLEPKVASMDKKTEHREGMLTTLQAERDKLTLQHKNQSKHSMTNTVVPFEEKYVAERSAQVIDIQKMRVPISKELEMVQKTISMTH